MPFSLSFKNKHLLLLGVAFCVVGILLWLLKIKAADGHHSDSRNFPKNEITAVTIKHNNTEPLVLTEALTSKKMNMVAGHEKPVDAGRRDDTSLATNHKTINATELVDDGRMNLSNLDKNMLKGGRLFSNELAHFIELKNGDLVDIQMPNIDTHGIISDNTMDNDGNNTVVLDFQEQDHGYMILYKSNASGTYNGEVFIRGQHYTYIANNDVGVIVDMKKFVSWPIE